MLSSKSTYLLETGRTKEALSAISRAVNAYQEHAEKRPDAFLPDLANTLHNKSLILARIGRHEEALEAIGRALSIRWELTRRHPNAFFAEYARSLVARSHILATSEQPTRPSTTTTA